MQYNNVMFVRVYGNLDMLWSNDVLKCFWACHISLSVRCFACSGTKSGRSSQQGGSRTAADKSSTIRTECCEGVARRLHRINVLWALPEIVGAPRGSMWAGKGTTSRDRVAKLLYYMQDVDFVSWISFCWHFALTFDGWGITRERQYQCWNSGLKTMYGMLFWLYVSPGCAELQNKTFVCNITVLLFLCILLNTSVLQLWLYHSSV